MFVHLHVHSQFSFLDGASPVKKLVQRAAACNMPALAITDHFNVSAAVLFHRAAEAAGIKPITGAEVILAPHNGHLSTKDRQFPGGHLTLLATGPKGYHNLCRLLTRALTGNPRSEPLVAWEDLARYKRGLIVLSGCRRGEIASLILQGKTALAYKVAASYKNILGADQFFIELQNNCLPRTGYLNKQLVELASQLDLDVVATNNVHYAHKTDFPFHDVLTCVRTQTTLNNVHPERRLNAENYLKSSEEMAGLFAQYPQALSNSLKIAARCKPALQLGRNLFPAYPVPKGETADSFLRKLTFQGARKRYGKITRKVVERLEHELKIIGDLKVADYFLAVWDVIRYAQKAGIRYAGRGSAADSAVVYCLFITDVDPISRGLLFERFLSLERSQKPDIDIDFDARYRDQVADYVYRRYGEDQVASVCTYNTYRARSAIRDFGKVLELPDDEIDRLAKLFPHIPADAVRPALETYPELRDSKLPTWKYNLLFDLCEKSAGLPRFFGTHLGGLVISRQPLTTITPLQMAAKGVLITQFDKDFVEDLGLIKLDLLSLRTLSAVEDTVRSAQNKGLDYDSIPSDDPATFRRLGRGETVGAFQLESPAQRALQARLGAENIEDVVASVALIRPGPIKGDMVEPFINRRQGKEPVTYIHPKLKPILDKTYGVVLFQEQVIEIATTIAGFTPGEADQLRRVMTHFRSQKEMDKIGAHFIAKAVKNGVSREIAETIFSYIVGYAGYGFCEAHAAAFGDTAYKTAYLLEHYPAHFYAAILNQQPMGFYPPNTICVEARRRGIKILPPDINCSQPNYTVEIGPEGRECIRVSLRQVKEIKDKEVEAILAARHEGPFTSLFDFARRATVSRDVIANLILAGAFDSLHSNRRQLIWQLPAILRLARSKETGLWEDSIAQKGAVVESAGSYSARVSDYDPLERFVHEYNSLGLNTEKHLMEFYRPTLQKKGFAASKDVQEMPAGKEVATAGIVIRPHRPPTKSGKTVVFLTLEDEYGLLDITVFENLYQKCGKIIFTYPALAIAGKIARRGRGVSITASKVAALPPLKSDNRARGKTRG